MSVFLIVTLAALFSGLLLVTFLAWYRSSSANVAGAIMMTIVLALWVIAGRNLPLSTSRPEPATLIPWPLIDLQIDNIAWQLSFYLLLLVVALLVVMASQSWPTTNRLVTPAILFVTLTTLLTLWVGTLSGLLVSWTLLVVSWSFLYWVGGVEIDRLLSAIRFCFTLLVGLLFLGLATITSGNLGTSGLNIADWPGAARTWALLAALWYLGVLPFHWWRPLKPAPSFPANALIFIVPAVGGSSLLIRIALGGGNNGYELFLTMLGLLSMLTGATLAWINLRKSASVASGLSLAQAGVITLVGSWSRPSAIVAEMGVMILAIGGLYLLAMLSSSRSVRFAPWIGIVYLAAIAGLPLTLGFLGRAPLYDAWQGRERLILLLVSGLIFMLIVAAAILSFWKHTEKTEKQPRSILQFRLYLAVILPAVGLLATPGFPLSGVSLLSWLTLFLSIAGALVLSRYGRQVRDIHYLVLRSFRVQLYLAPLQRVLKDLGTVVAQGIRDATAILEGEGGMLWLLVLVIILWLARRG